MQCTSYVPVYYHTKNLNERANGFSLHLFDGDCNYVEARGSNISLPFAVEQYLSYDKDALKRMMQNHDATFRFQVHELHRLYRKQRELMDEMKNRGNLTQHLQLQTLELNYILSKSWSSICQTPPRAMSCLKKSFPGGKMSPLSTKGVQERPTFFTRKCQNPTKVQSSPFVATNSFNGVKAPPLQTTSRDMKILDPEIPAYICHDNVKEQLEEASCDARPEILDAHPQKEMGYLSSSGMSCQKTNFLIDLNQPASLGLLESSSSAPFGTCSDKTVNGISGGEAKLESVLDECCRLVTFRGGYAERTSLLDIDLNSTPLSCISTTTITVESAGNTSVEEMKLKVRASTENELSSPVGISGDIQTESLLFFDVVGGESALDFDKIGAEILVTISTSRIGQCSNISSLEPTGNLDKTLHWFAGIAVSTCQETETIDMTQSLQHSGRNFHVEVEKQIGKLASSLKRDPVNRTSQHKNFRKAGSLRRNTGKNAREKPGKCSKLQHLDVVQKSLDSKLRHQPCTRVKKGFLQKCLGGWGKIRKRQDGHRRRASKFFLIG